MNKIKITNNQIFSLTASFSCGTSILVIPATAAGLAKQDAWIAMLIAVIYGLFDIGLFYFLWSKLPGITFVEMIKRIYGNMMGSIIAMGFLFFSLLSTSDVLWYLGTFMTVQVIPETPVYFINTLFIATVVIALLYGIETIARSYEIFIPFVSILFILSMILVLPNARIQNILPVLENGFSPVLKGSFILSSFSFPNIVFLMLFPINAQNTKKAKKSFINGFLWGQFLVLASIIVSILVLGSTISSSSSYPVYLLAKEINLGILFTRLEFIVAAVWVITLLSRVIFYLYSGVVGLSQLLELKDHKKVILPLGLIVLVLSGLVFPDVIYRISWDTYVWPIFSATFGLILPKSMVIGFYIKKLTFENSGGQV